VTALPCLNDTIIPQPQPLPEPTAPVAEDPAPAPPPATHVLRDDRAQPLIAAGTALEGGWELFNSGDGWQLRGTGVAPQVNNNEYQTGQLLGRGDSIVLKEHAPLLLIEVEA